MIAGLQRLGSSVFFPLQYKPVLEQAGFVQIEERKHASPNNACYPGKRLQRIGTLMAKMWLDVLEPISVPVFGALGWTPSQLSALLKEVYKEVGDTKYHSYMTL